MPPKRLTKEEREEEEKVAKQLKETFEFIEKMPGYKPYTLERDYKHLGKIRYMLGELDDMLVQGMLTDEQINEITHRINFLKTHKKVLEHHLARAIPELNANANANMKELNEMAGKRGGSRRRGRRSTRKRRGTRRA